MESVLSRICGLSVEVLPTIEMTEICFDGKKRSVCEVTNLELDIKSDTVQNLTLLEAIQVEHELNKSYYYNIKRGMENALND